MLFGYRDVWLEEDQIRGNEKQIGGYMRRLPINVLQELYEVILTIVPLGIIGEES